MADKASIPILREKSTHAGGMCLHCNAIPVYEAYYGEEFGLCGPCAERVANLYSYAHSGRWLTYANEATAKPLRPIMPADLRWSVLREAGFACQSCGAADRPLHVDHIIPLAKGGSSERANLQCLCDRCNLSKGAK